MKHLRSLFWIFLIALVTFSCKDDDGGADVLSVTGFSPQSGAPGTDVTLTGTKFGTDASKVQVNFGSVPATVKSVTNTQIVATVPVGAPDGPITVVVNGETVNTNGNFTVSARTAVEVNADITANTTWSAANVYLLRKQYIYVRDGVTLTIEPGTVIKAGGTAAGPTTDPTLKSTIIIERGAKIDARGTATSPIVFTSEKPAGQRAYGDWGGIVLVGKAPMNRPEGTPIEGGIAGSYGGSDPNDNSGVLQYVRIEFPGVTLSTGAGSEVNGLSLYGVGAGTTIDHIQVSYSGDDSYEWFGGTANAKYLVAYRGFDDDFDTDHGFTGKVQFGLALRDPAVADVSSSNAFESDNFAGTGLPATAPANGLPLTAPVFANISVFGNQQTPSNAATSGGSGSYQSAMHLRRNTSTSIFNSVFVGYPEGLRLDGTAAYNNATAGTMQLRGIVLANMTTPVRGAGDANNGAVSNEQAQAFFNTPAFGNQIVELGTLGFNAAQFNLTQPAFLPTAGSPLLSGAGWTDKGADTFFERVTYKGAFGTTDWTAGWTNFNPQQTDYR
jgi:uncharacterized protein (TIGR03437 family)